MRRHLASTLLAISLTLGLVGSSLLPVQASPHRSGAAAASLIAPVQQALPPPILFGDFDIATNGFGFQNYGGTFPEGDMTVAEVRELFGDQVCRRLDGTTCVPSVDTQLWLDSMNQYMTGGHCNGFTVMSHRLFAGEFAAADFATQAESVFAIDQNVPIMRRIAQNWTQQVTDEIVNAEFWGTPQEVVDALRSTTELVELKIYFDNLGHSMLAYGLQEMGDGHYHILVYDNNWPGRTGLFVEVDYPANSWRYSLAALNPDQDAATWSGDARSWPPNLVFVPLSAYREQLTCPFCSAAATGAANVTNVSLTGAGDFLVRDERGRHSGIWAGAAINNIPGSRLRRTVGAPSNKGALLGLPGDGNITIQVGNTSLAESEPGDLRILSPGFSVALDDLVLAQNRTEELAFSPREQTVAFRANRPQQPVFKLALQGEAGVDHLFVLAGAEFGPDQQLSVRADPQNGLVLASDQLSATQVTLIMARMGPTGEAIFATDGLTLPVGGALAMDYASWNGLAPLAVQIDADGDGLFEQPNALENTFPQAPVASATSGDWLTTVLNEVAPYMDATDKAAFLDALRSAPLDGDDIGRLLLGLNEFNLSDDELADFFGKAALPSDELAEAIHEVRRDGASQAVLLDRLGLSAADRETVVAELRALDEVRDVLVDLDFLDPQPHERVAAMLPFVVDRGLNPRQLGNLFERFVANGTLSIAETDRLVDSLGLQPDVAAQIRGDLPVLAGDVAPAAAAPLAQANPPQVAQTAATPAPAEAAPAVEPPPTPTEAVASEASPSPTATPVAQATATPLPAPAAAPATAEGLLSFESFGAWRRGDQPYGELTQSVGAGEDGGSAAQLSYDFAGATSADDFVIFTQRAPLPGNPNTLQAWVNGDGSGHLFNIWVEDANGEVWSVAMGAVAHTGWQQMVGVVDPNAPWPGGRVYGPENGIIDYPIRFLGLVIDRTDGPAAGTLLFDGITSNADPSLTLAQPAAPPDPVADASDPCADIPAPSSGYELKVRFVNGSAVPVVVYWIDFDNQLDDIVRLAPGEMHDEDSFVTHRWVIQDVNGATLAEYTNTDALTQCVQIR